MDPMDRDEYDMLHEPERPTLVGVLRSGGRRLFATMVGGATGAVGGALFALVVTRSRDRDRGLPEEERLMADVRIFQGVRQIVPAALAWLENNEYIARKKLEEMGYLPCEVCGVPHQTEERHDMPPGTYWHDEYGFVRPDDERWKAEDYEAAEDRWEMNREPSDDDEPMH